MATDVLILCWEEAELVRESVRRIKYDHPNRIIVVDNGSSLEQKEILRSIKDILLIDLPDNTGPSVGRNMGLEVTSSKYVFLLDGDILYIPKTIPHLEEVMERNEDAGCIGVHNSLRWDGTKNRDEADLRFTPGELHDDFAQAWTQYGLFHGDFLKKTKFYAEGVFGIAGTGSEDNWLYMDILKAGLKSYYMDGVLYYHEAHKGSVELKKRGLPLHDVERKAIFEAFWQNN